MKAISAVLRCAVVSAALVTLTVPAFADAFMDACMMDTGSGIDMTKTCACLSKNTPAESRADATLAMRVTNQASIDRKPIDPSNQPPNVMRGMQAVVLAQAQCM